MTTPPNHTTDLPPGVQRVLEDVRRRFRAYVWLEGLAMLIVALGAAFWVGLYLDWRLDPSPAVRRVALGAVLMFVFYVGYRYLVRRVFVPFSDASAAVLLERRYARLGDHVLTTVHVANSPDRAAAYHPDLVAQTQFAAVQAIAEVATADIFNRRPLARAIGGAAAVGVSIALFAALAGDSFGVWLDRMALSPDPWPRRVRLEVVGFPRDENGHRVHRLAAEDNLELLVRARTTGFAPPDIVEIQYRLADGRRDRDTMIRVGDAGPGRDGVQLYRYEFKRVTADTTIDVVAGDKRPRTFWLAVVERLVANIVRPPARVRDLQIEVVARPELSSIELACEYPDYLRRESRRLAVTGGMRIPVGTRLVLHAASTKPLTATRIHTSQSSKNVELTFAGGPQDVLRWEYGPLTGDDVILVNLTDADGVDSREPYRVSLAVVPDEVPQVVVRLAGIGAAITPDARIPVVGKVTDEYGLDKIWFEYRVEGEPVARRPLARQPAGQLSVSDIDAFDARATDMASGQRLLALAPGQRLALSLKATDQFDLSDLGLEASNEPRVGSSPQFLLDVVTVSQLLALLERRELELRQRFEAIYEKTTDTRNLLSRVEFAELPDGSESASRAGPDLDRIPDPQIESDRVDSPAESDPAAAQRALARRRLRVAGSLQNITQAADEILGVAEAFDDVHDQLTNNRIDNPDLKSRLREQIALPLRHIGEIRMPELAAQVQLLEQRIEDAAAGPPALDRALALADEVLVEMRHVLDRMLELETYNEVVALLRAIISDQEEINRQTKEQRQLRLRDMFEEE